MTEQEIQHQSFGVIIINRGNYASFEDSYETRRALFGSSILHDSFIQVSIHRATLTRRLNSDFISPLGSPIVEVQMSSTQFADAITSFNKGEGTPCTITFVNGKEVTGQKLESKRVQFDKEFQEMMEQIASKVNPFYSEIDRILQKSSLGKRDKEEIKKQIGLIQQEIEANIPFVKEQFTEQMDRTVLEVKNEFSEFIDGKLRGIGLEKFKKQLMERGDVPSLEVKTEENNRSERE